ncbi:DUF559 domain-containing protein [Priestia endophytica]|jgi:very-short-patch-repair endonuclease|uniref:DUF559 domain-containing protein n=1 Tax=Priestia endophytica TaxID=135735 RepID=A0AAX1QE93_9BACI|nr:DUF559 domain-containing protein [Priestia endophytica]MCM3538829.1 very short patch repair endonuclease [Priestia endophytica]RAS82023.1 hypothetical protein A3864_00515 [Priestia endophytica]RAS84614.1 hypothetical protein A3863_25805 [Priestia endophytica]
MEHIFIVSIVIALILTVTGTLIFIIASTFQNDEQEYVLNKQRTDILHEKLSKALDMCGYDLRLNEPYGRFMIDVMIPKYKVAIILHRHPQTLAKKSDKKEEKLSTLLRRRGWKVVEVKEREVMKHVHQAVLKVQREIFKQPSGS